MNKNGTKNEGIYIYSGQVIFGKVHMVQNRDNIINSPRLKSNLVLNFPRNTNSDRNINENSTSLHTFLLLSILQYLHNNINNVSYNGIDT